MPPTNDESAAADAIASAGTEPTRTTTSRRRPSMADVAVLAGVSAQTVSRVSNGRDNVDPVTRQRVRAAMATLGYRANGAARSLATGSFRTIGVIASTLTTYGAQQVLDGVAEEARRCGYDIALMPLTSPSPEDVTGAAELMLGRHRVDALVVGVESDVLAAIFPALHVDVPFVVTDGGPEHPHLPRADSDPEPGLRDALHHLIAGGHTRIWHASGPSDSNSAHQRRAVWEAVLREHDLDVVEPLLTDWSSQSGYEAGLLVADAVARDVGRSPTAVLCTNDQTALGMVRALADRNLRVPHDVSVVGFDDSEAGRFSVPRLSTIQHDLHEVGRRAVQILVEQLEPGSSTGPLDLVPSRFIARESSARRP